MTHSFHLTDEQSARIKTWERNHRCPITNEGAIGGKITYKFTPTSIGVAQGAKCACGEKINVTDYESW